MKKAISVDPHRRVIKLLRGSQSFTERWVSLYECMKVLLSSHVFTGPLSDLPRSGYEAAAKHFAPADLDVNLSGRSFMITGANSGIGKATAQEIANRGEFGYTTEEEHLSLTSRHAKVQEDKRPEH